MVQDPVDERSGLKTATDDAHGVAHAGCDHDLDGLRQEDAPAGVLLDEVRALLSQAEDWVREEPEVPDGVVDALERSKSALAAGESRAPKLLLGR